MPRRLAILAALTAACGGEPTPDPGPPCVDDQCDAAESKAEVLDAIEDHGDPIADFLRGSLRDDGTVQGDYQSVLDGVGDGVGCSKEEERSFVVLSNDAFIPKTIFTRCDADPQEASRFFVAVPALGPDGGVEPRLLHLAAWDDEAEVYRRYSTLPDEADGMRIAVEPRFCLGCHGGPEELPYWQPLMNEMTNPWSQWNAEPGFASQAFDDFLDPHVAADPVFRELTAEHRLRSASELEPIVRAGIDRVTGARARGRNDVADLGKALDLLRPLFCDETVNYVSEIHRSGEIRSSVAVDDALRTLFPAAGIDGSWAWLTDRELRLPEPNEEEDSLTLLAVRGESSLQTELTLVTRGAIPADLALQVRALDWMRPAASDFRCGLYKSGRARIEAGALDSIVGETRVGGIVGDLLVPALREILRLETSDGLVSLIAAEGGTVYSIPDAAAVADTLATGDLSALAISHEAFGDAIEMRTLTVSRDELLDERVEEACSLADRFTFAPLRPDAACQ